MRRSSTTLLIIFLLTGCISTLPRSAEGLYDSKPGPQNVRGSVAQASLIRIVDFDREQIISAASSAIQQLGYDIDLNDKTSGRLAASRSGQCENAYRVVMTLAVYVEPVDTYPTSRFNLLVDRHAGDCGQTSEALLAEQLANRIELILQNS